MVIDTSALISILLGEPEAESFARALASDWKRLLSSVSALETATVIEAKKGKAGGRELDLLLHRARIEIIPFDCKQFEIAWQAWQSYGKGRHAAGLNLGDCCAYALSKASGQPLLFKGNDFGQTDLSVVPL